MNELPRDDRPQLLTCTGCGRESFDDLEDLAALRKAGRLSCCPDRNMVAEGADPETPMQAARRHAQDAVNSLVFAQTAAEKIVVAGHTARLSIAEAKGLLVLMLAWTQ